MSTHNMFFMKKYGKLVSLMHKSVVTPAPLPHQPPTYGDGQRIAGLMCGAVTFRVPPQCRACDITQINPRGIYYYKEEGYHSQQATAVQGF